MNVRRLLFLGGVALSLIAVAFSVGSWTAHRAMAQQLADNDARLAALSDHVARSIVRLRQTRDVVGTTGTAQSSMVEEIKKQLQAEMGLMPPRLLRARRQSFVELNTVDSTGKAGYGTAGYLGDGYFITVKHAVVILNAADNDRSISSITVRYKGKDVAADLVDAGDATEEVHSGDWALIKAREPLDLPPLRIDAGYTYDFAEPIFRLGNDYSKGIVASAGYVGQHTANGLVTCLTDGHPGVSGGGVLNQNGDLVGIPIGRMVGDYRFSFILPIRQEMFRSMPEAPTAVTPVVTTTASLTQ